MTQSKGQIVMEFMIVVFILLFISMMFALYAADELSEISEKKSALQLRDVGVLIKNEIGLAQAMESGFSRNFDVPLNIESGNYSISMERGFVYVSQDDQEIVVAVLNYTGSVVKGKNNIRKENGNVIING